MDFIIENPVIKQVIANSKSLDDFNVRDLNTKGLWLADHIDKEEWLKYNEELLEIIEKYYNKIWK